MALIRLQPKVDPVSGILALQRELDRFLRNPNFSLGVSGYGAYPPINIFDDREGVVIMAEIPGVDPTAVQITSQGNTLTISAKRERQVDPNEAVGFHRRERPVGEFSRSIQLPEGLDLQKTSAKCDAGLLIVRVPKAESAKPRQITVEAA